MQGRGESVIDVGICPVARVNAQVRVRNSAFCEEVRGEGPLNLWSGRGKQWHNRPRTDRGVCGLCHLSARCPLPRGEAIGDVWETGCLNSRRPGPEGCSLSPEGGRGSQAAGLREVLWQKVTWELLGGCGEGPGVWRARKRVALVEVSPERNVGCRASLAGRR